MNSDMPRHHLTGLASLVLALLLAVAAAAPAIASAADPADPPDDPCLDIQPRLVDFDYIPTLAPTSGAPLTVTATWPQSWSSPVEQGVHLAIDWGDGSARVPLPPSRQCDETPEAPNGYFNWNAGSLQHAYAHDGVYAVNMIEEINQNGQPLRAISLGAGTVTATTPTQPSGPPQAPPTGLSDPRVGNTQTGRAPTVPAPRHVPRQPAALRGARQAVADDERSLAARLALLAGAQCVVRGLPAVVGDTAASKVFVRRRASARSCVATANAVTGAVQLGAALSGSLPSTPSLPGALPRGIPIYLGGTNVAPQLASQLAADQRLAKALNQEAKIQQRLLDASSLAGQQQLALQAMHAALTAAAAATTAAVVTAGVDHRASYVHASVDAGTVTVVKQHATVGAPLGGTSPSASQRQDQRALTNAIRMLSNRRLSAAQLVAPDAVAHVKSLAQALRGYSKQLGDAFAG